MPDPEKEEPKLIIDEDWKESVQREKEQAAKQQQAGAETVSAPGETSPSSDSSPSSETPSPSETDRLGETDQSEPGPPGRETETEAAAGASREANGLPPASFELLVTTLATQAMMALGQLPDPSGKPAKVEKPIAKHYIDMLAVLEEKCKGNLDAGEQKLISEVLHNLRMGFVATR